MMKKLFAMLLLLMLCVGLVTVASAATITESKPANGDGSVDNPYQITTAEELLWFQKNAGNSANAILMNDITYNQNVIVNGELTSDTGSLNKWTPIGTYNSPYKGTFDGNDHYIAGLYISGSEGQGFIGNISGGTVTGLTIKDSYIQGSRYVGALVGRCKKNTSVVIQNCHNDGSIVISTGFNDFSYAGGILGGEEGSTTISISNCTNNGIISGSKQYVGGIVGGMASLKENAIISNCTNSGQVIGAKGYIGGIAGYCGASYGNPIYNISECTNSGTVTMDSSTTSNYVGGILGYATSTGTIQDCTNSGQVCGNHSVGGIVGQNGGKCRIENCKNTVQISGASYRVGGIAGISTGTVIGCFNTGDVNGANNVGGVIGHGGGTVSECYNEGDVKANTSYAGGIVGCVDSNSGALTAVDCYNAGTVNGTKYVGGAIGSLYNGSKVENCHSFGNVIGTDSYIGGFAGKTPNNAIISNCYYLSTLPTDTNALSKTSEEFKSESLVGLLNADRTGVNAVWTQGESYPVFGTPVTTFTVTLPTGTGYTVAAAEGSSSPVNEGGSYSFIVSISDGHQKGSGFAVKANDTPLTEQDGKYTITNINENQIVTVEGVEEIPSYTVSISVNPAEGGTVIAQVNGTSVHKAAEGDTVTLTATANDGYRFKEWQVVSGGAAIDNNQFTMSGNDVEVKAVFERVYKVIIAQDIQNGTLEADKYVAAAGETVILSATPATGYTKGQYKTTLHGEGAIGLSGDTLTMPACDVTVSVTFLPINTHTVSKTSQAGLTVRSSSHPYDKVPDGETYTFTVETWDGYEKTNSFAVTANGLPITPDADGVYSIPNVTANQVILVWGVFPCKPDAAEDFKDGSNYPFTLVCKDNAEHTYTAPYYNSEYITNISAVYGNVNSADGWRCDVTFDVEKYAAANNHRITTQMTATASFTLKWDTSTKKWAYVNETVTYDITCAPTLTGIAVTTQPKLDYSEGDALDLSAMVIMASWSDNSTTELGYADVTASIANGTTLAKAAHNGEVITVTYNGQTAQTNALSVKSGNTSVSAVEVKSVAGTIEGNAISVVLPYGNNLADLTSDDFTVTLADFAANVTAQPASNDGGTTWLFTVTAENGTTQVYTVNVSIGEDPDAPDKTDVSTIKLAISNHNWTVAQETANTSEAMKAWIEATLANSNLNGVTASEVTITAITPAVAGDMYNLTGTNGSFCFTVKLSKGNVTDTVEITTGVITATAYSGNAFVPVTDITGVPTSTTAGTPLTLTGIVEPGNATYTTIAWSVKDAGTTGAAISDNTLTATTAGDVIVTATIANGKSATEAFTKDFTITVGPAPVVLTGIVVTTAPTKTVYTEGEFFNPAGMVVTANYSDGSSKAVTGYALSPNGALTTANTTVTVTYMENGITKTASQAISVNAKPAATYTVTFDSNGGSGTMVPQTFTEGVAQNLTLNAFTREGFTFIGWNTAANGSGNSFADGASVTASGNVTLYAQWQKNAAAVYTVTVSNDGNGTGTAVPSSGVTGTEVELTATPNSGYRFKEWQVVTGGVTVTDNKLMIGTANVEVKAIFELIPAATYTITFDPNGGSGMMAPQTFTEGVAQNLTLNAFIREGFTFIGWNTMADGSGNSFVDGASVTASSNATLYAQWKAVPVVTPLTITKQPTDQFVVEGQRAEFSVEAAGDGLTYQWYINRNDGRGWRELDGAIGTAYVTSVTDLECDGFQYGCLITDQYGNILKSDVAVLHVSKVPVLPETGDSSTPMLWLAMSILSMVGIVLLRKKAYSR